MKEGWINSRIGDICSITDFVSNGSFASLRENVKYYNSPNYAVLVRLADASNGFDKSKFVYTDEHGYDFSKKSHLHGGELIMSNVGSVGSMFICPVMAQPMTLAPNTISITSQNNKFLYYYFLSDGFKKKLKGITSSTTLKKFNKTNFKLLEIPIPPLSEQQSIVDYLDSAFAKIDAMKANAEKALDEAKALFQASLKEMLEPKEGWEEKTLGELATDMYRGSGIKRDQVTKEGTPCVRYGEIYTTYNVGFDSCVSHTKEEYISSPKYFEHGDLLFAITGESVEDIGKTIAYLGNEKCLCGGDIICMKHMQNPKFLAYALSTPDAIRQKGMGKTKLKVVHTNAPSLKAISIPVPTLAEQQSVVDSLDSLKSKVDRLQANYDKISQECDALKQAILRQVFE